METKVYNTIKKIIKEKEEARRWPLKTNILAIAEALPDVPMAEIKKALNALYKSKKIATQNGINHVLIYLNKEQ
jgi:threonine synthase